MRYWLCIWLAPGRVGKLWCLDRCVEKMEELWDSWVLVDAHEHGMRVADEFVSMKRCEEEFP